MERSFCSVCPIILYIWRDGGYSIPNPVFWLFYLSVTDIRMWFGHFVVCVCALLIGFLSTWCMPCKPTGWVPSISTFWVVLCTVRKLYVSWVYCRLLCAMDSRWRYWSTDVGFGLISDDRWHSCSSGQNKKMPFSVIYGCLAHLCISLFLLRHFRALSDLSYSNMFSCISMSPATFLYPLFGSQAIHNFLTTGLLNAVYYWSLEQVFYLLCILFVHSEQFLL